MSTYLSDAARGVKTSSGERGLPLGAGRAMTLGALAALSLLAGCAAKPEAPPVAAVSHPNRIPPQDFAPGMVTETAPPAGVTLVNDPSAPLTTPLCGTAAREANAAGAALYPQPAASGNSCTQNACFDPATVTYIASDNTRRVCR